MVSTNFDKGRIFTEIILYEENLIMARLQAAKKLDIRQHPKNNE
jgi:hypothetical protein